MTLVHPNTLLVMLLTSLVLIPAGCRPKEAIKPEAEPNYAQTLDPGKDALRLVRDDARIRRILENTYATNDTMLIEAVAKSAGWYGNPSAQTHFPIAGIEFERAQDSVRAILDLLSANPSQGEFIGEIMQRFDLYESVGWDGRGTVLFTGYCAPEFEASLEPSGDFIYPLYKRPADLATDPNTGKPLGRKVGDRIERYPTRREIETSGMLRGTELVWFRNPLDAYIIHVNGSARLRLTNGSTMYIGYAGKTDRPYRGLGSTLLMRGLLPQNKPGLPAIRQLYDREPGVVTDAIYENENYVFFQEYPPGNWPAGSLGLPVTPRRSLATDKAIFPRGSVVIVETDIPRYSRGTRPFVQMMLDQDTGGAIKAPGRADIYLGEGLAAELLAGRQYHEGHLYYLFLKNE